MNVMVHYFQGPTLRFRQILSAVSELGKKKQKTQQLTSAAESSHLGCNLLFKVTNVQSWCVSSTLDTECLCVNGRRQVCLSCRSRPLIDVHMNISRFEPIQHDIKGGKIQGMSEDRAR